jgi:hypothetical protein
VIKHGTPSVVAWNSVVLVYDFAFGLPCLTRAVFAVAAGNHNVIRFHKGFGATLTRESEATVQFLLLKESKCRQTLRSFCGIEVD